MGVRVKERSLKFSEMNGIDMELTVFGKKVEFYYVEGQKLVKNLKNVIVVLV